MLTLGRALRHRLLLFQPRRAAAASAALSRGSRGSPATAGRFRLHLPNLPAPITEEQKEAEALTAKLACSSQQSQLELANQRATQAEEFVTQLTAEVAAVREHKAEVRVPRCPRRLPTGRLPLALRGCWRRPRHAMRRSRVALHRLCRRSTPVRRPRAGRGDVLRATEHEQLGTVTCL